MLWLTLQLFLENSYLTKCDAEIIEIENDKVRLDKTIFYPAGGGQEHDTGFLKQGDVTFKVYKVKKESGEINHYVKNPERLLLGPVIAEIDWKKRYAFMRNHSMLHVVGSVFHKRHKSLCTGNQIYQEKARIDLTEISNINNEDVKLVIQEANNELKKNHLISSRVLPREEVGDLSDSIKTVVNLIPKTVSEIRLVSIGDIDEQACGGTHVSNTNEIGGILLEKTKSKGKGVMRLELKSVT